MTFSASRHRLLLSLALARWPLPLDQLAEEVQLDLKETCRQIDGLRESGLVLMSSSGPLRFRLRPGVVVGERSVGYLVPLDMTPKPYGRLVALESGR